jgi:hypothetical protein
LGELDNDFSTPADGSSGLPQDPFFLSNTSDGDFGDEESDDGSLLFGFLS